MNPFVCILQLSSPVQAQIQIGVFAASAGEAAVVGRILAGVLDASLLNTVPASAIPGGFTKGSIGAATIAVGTP